MSTPDAGHRLFIRRADLRQSHVGPDPESPALRVLAAGEARLQIEHFAMTANNITYAAFGEAMKYWQFFPSGQGDLACLPVWGFATVCESTDPALTAGRRVWGYLPAGSYTVVRAERISATGFVDGAEHRRELAAVYNRYGFCDADAAWRNDLEGTQAVLRPLFTTSFLIDDFLAENDFFGARQIVLSSASSKTAYGTAFCLSRRGGTPSTLQLTGLTSPGNAAFSRSLGCYDDVRLYDDIAALDPAVPTVYVDFAGDAPLRRKLHVHFGESLRYSSSIGGTHWSDLGSGRDLPGPKPTLFFAPAQVKRRSAAPPDGWGREGFDARLGEAWAAFVERVNDRRNPWLSIVEHRGPEALQSAYDALLAGRVNAREGLMIAPAAQEAPRGRR